MLREAVAGVALATLMALTGCSSMDRSACTGLVSASGALLGATAGGLISGVAADHGDEGGSKNWEIGLSTGGGALLGSLVGFGLSQAICKEPPPPPPPPAPAARPAPPPPPPPPPTERRGG
jgi:hypothetical protein